MADFVCDDVSFRKLAGVAVGATAKFILKVVEKRGIEVNALIARTIKWPHGRSGKGTGGWFGAGEEPQLWWMIGTPIGGEDLGPNIFRAAQHRGYELTGLVVWGAGVDLGRWATLLRGLSTTGEDLCAADKHAWIDTERPADQTENNDHADAETATATGYAQAPAARRTRLAVILDVATLAQIVPAHILLPSEFQPSYESLQRWSLPPSFLAMPAMRSSSMSTLPGKLRSGVNPTGSRKVPCPLWVKS